MIAFYTIPWHGNGTGIQISTFGNITVCKTYVVYIMASNGPATQDAVASVDMMLTTFCLFRGSIAIRFSTISIITACHIIPCLQIYLSCSISIYITFHRHSFFSPDYLSTPPSLSRSPTPSLVSLTERLSLFSLGFTLTACFPRTSAMTSWFPDYPKFPVPMQHFC